MHLDWGQLRTVCVACFVRSYPQLDDSLKVSETAEYFLFVRKRSDTEDEPGRCVPQRNHANPHTVRWLPLGDITIDKDAKVEAAVKERADGESLRHQARAFAGLRPSEVHEAEDPLEGRAAAIRSARAAGTVHGFRRRYIHLAA
eukprot:1194280-Prorocentrum_minimum.AAC.9